MKRKYHKLVRDKIPKIIRQNGNVPIIHIAGEREYWRQLKAKLLEEVKEFSKSESLEELADIFEVADAIISFRKISRHKLKTLQKRKAAQRGGFKKRIILEGAK